MDNDGVSEVVLVMIVGFVVGSDCVVITDVGVDVGLRLLMPVGSLWLKGSVNIDGGIVGILLGRWVGIATTVGRSVVLVVGFDGWFEKKGASVVGVSLCMEGIVGDAVAVIVGLTVLGLLGWLY